VFIPKVNSPTRLYIRLLQSHFTAIKSTHRTVEKITDSKQGPHSNRMADRN